MGVGSGLSVGVEDGVSPWILVGEGTVVGMIAGVGIVVGRLDGAGEEANTVLDLPETGVSQTPYEHFLRHFSPTTIKC